MMPSHNSKTSWSVNTEPTAINKSSHHLICTSATAQHHINSSGTRVIKIVSRSIQVAVAIKTVVLSIIGPRQVMPVAVIHIYA